MEYNRLIDHTVLKPDTQEAAVIKLCEEALEYDFASVCVNPTFVELCAKLLIEFELPLTRLVGHHFFSGKWCPQPMLENDMEIWWEFVELVRQEMALFNGYANYQLNMTSKSKYLDDNGRITSQPAYSQCVTYTVEYTVNGSTKSVTLSSIIPGTIK